MRLTLDPPIKPTSTVLRVCMCYLVPVLRVSAFPIASTYGTNAESCVLDDE